MPRPMGRYKSEEGVGKGVIGTSALDCQLIFYFELAGLRTREKHLFFGGGGKGGDPGLCIFSGSQWEL